MSDEEILEIAKQIYRTDWYYNYSDDYGAYRSGESQVKSTRLMMQEHDWNEENYSSLIRVFFDFAKIGFPNKPMPDSYREAWTKTINSLTGR